MKKSLWVCISFLLFFFLASFLCVGNVMAYQPFPDTGQTKCYDDEQEIDCPAPGEPFYGQDAQYQPRLPRSYTKLGHGGVELSSDAAHIDDGGEWIMTRDNVTGLIWEIKTKENKYNRYEYYDALDIFLKNLNENEFGGYSDWRLPNIKELSSLVKSENYSPAIDKEWFPNARPSIYWSSTEHAQKPNSAWYVYFSEGHVLDTITSNSFYARAVRGEQSSPEPLIDNKDGTFTDPNTGLMWEKNPRARRFTWQDSLYYAENLRYAGYSDWRLPSRHELQTLVDYSQHNPAIDPLFPGESFTAGYWSSSIHTKGTSLAWYVSLGFGIILNDNMEDRYFRRAVRVIEKDPTDKDIDVEVPEDKDKDDGSSSSSSGCVVGTLF